MDIRYSIIVPLFNRPDEIDDLLQSLTKQTFEGDFEVVVVEDGSREKAENVVEKYKDRLRVKYLYKENTGPGDSRNYAMKQASGNYFIILDSDCILPNHYMEYVDCFLKKNYVDCFGGPDASDDSFSDVQKAINYSMTSFFTTGGIRGNKKSLSRFEPRSFNMGISKEVFQRVGGYGKIHPGEDPDLTMKIWDAGFKTAFIEEAFVYHKRRINWKLFKKQVSKFGQTRPILNLWHPKYRKFIHWLPSLFTIGLVVAIALSLWGHLELITIYSCYLALILCDSTRQYKSLKIGVMSLWATLIQMSSYGLGFLRSSIVLAINKNKTPQELFAHLFFK